MQLRSRTLGALAMVLAGCAAPVMHARTGEVLHVGESRAAFATVLFVQAWSRAELHSADETLTRSGTYEDPWTGRFFRTGTSTSTMASAS